jgi:SAM-dependent methyltransferase
MNGIHESFGRVTRVASRLRQRLASVLGPQPEWVKKKRVVDAQFDSALGVDTGGITVLKRLDVAGDAQDGVPHIASDPDEFSAAMAALGIDFTRFTFVDLGAGKGRALLLAARHGFRRIVGVEFARELVEVAQRNLKVAGDAAGVTTILHQDATTYDLPDEPLVLFLYNPFGARTMEAVARRTRASFDRNPRPLHVVYVVPEQLQAWVDAGFVAERRDHFAILRPAPS